MIRVGLLGVAWSWGVRVGPLGVAWYWRVRVGPLGVAWCWGVNVGPSGVTWLGGGQGWPLWEWPGLCQTLLGSRPKVPDFQNSNFAALILSGCSPSGL